MTCAPAIYVNPLAHASGVALRSQTAKYGITNPMGEGNERIRPDDE